MSKFGNVQVLIAVLCLLTSAQAQVATHDQMLRRLILDAAHGRIAYQTLAPSLAEAIRSQAATAQTELSALGPLKSLTLQATDKSGMELYRTEFENGDLDWAFHVNDAGLIDNALYRPARK